MALWVQQLLWDGYEEIEVTQTLLGRIRIKAEKGDIEREIIFNPQTGEILRDYSQGGDGGAACRWALRSNLKKRMTGTMTTVMMTEVKGRVL